MKFISSFAKSTVAVAAITSMSVVPVYDGLKFRTVVCPERIAPVLHDKPVFRNTSMQTHANFANSVVASAAGESDFSDIIEKIYIHLRNHVDTRLQTSIREIYRNSGALKLIIGQKHHNPLVPWILTMLGVGFELPTASKSRRYADFMAPARALGARGVRRPITMDVANNPSPTVSDDESEDLYDSENAASLQRDAVIGINNVASRLRTQVAQAPAPVEDELLRDRIRIGRDLCFIRIRRDNIRMGIKAGNDQMVNQVEEANKSA